MLTEETVKETKRCSPTCFMRSVISTILPSQLAKNALVLRFSASNSFIFAISWSVQVASEYHLSRPDRPAARDPGWPGTDWVWGGSGVTFWPITSPSKCSLVRPVDQDEVPTSHPNESAPDDPVPPKWVAQSGSLLPLPSRVEKCARKGVRWGNCVALVFALMESCFKVRRSARIFSEEETRKKKGKGGFFFQGFWRNNNGTTVFAYLVNDEGTSNVHPFFPNTNFIIIFPKKRNT